MRQHDHNTIPRPFLRWVGGKTQLLGTLTAWVGKAGAFRAYHEPFLGGGALFFALHRNGGLKRRQVHLSDTNQPLVDAYRGVQTCLPKVTAHLRAHHTKHDRVAYYDIRKVDQDYLTLPERAARFIYLNQACFNGFYREDEQGRFNVPPSASRTKLVLDDANLKECSLVLAKTTLAQRHVADLLEYVRPGDLVYLDPPYLAPSGTAVVPYGRTRFGIESQRLLAVVVRRLHRRRVKIILSNSLTPDTLRLYRGFHIERIVARRSVSSRAQGRTPKAELLVRNF